MNESPDDCQYIYSEIPLRYRWMDVQRKWVLRQVRFGIVARLNHVLKHDNEMVALRLLLQHVRGLLSYRNLRTVDRTEYATCHEAALALNVINTFHIPNRTICAAVLSELPGVWRPGLIPFTHAQS